MKKTSGQQIAMYSILSIFAVAAILISHFYSSSYEHLSIERFIISTFGAIPIGILGIVTLIKPELAKEELEILDINKKISEKNIKLMGYAFCFQALVMIYNAWKVFSINF
jgi:hypothetical protein